MAYIVMACGTRCTETASGHGRVRKTKMQTGATRCLISRICETTIARVRAHARFCARDIKPTAGGAAAASYAAAFKYLRLCRHACVRMRGLVRSCVRACLCRRGVPKVSACILSTRHVAAVLPTGLSRTPPQPRRSMSGRAPRSTRAAPKACRRRWT